MIERVSRVWREEGLRGVWFGLLAQTVYRRLVVVELDLSTLPDVAPAPAGVEFGYLAPGELKEYHALRGDVGDEHAEQRLARGERCFVARRGQTIISARWAATREAHVAYLARTVPLAEGDVYIHDTFTLPAERGSGLSAAALTRFAPILAAEGHRRLIAHTLPENRNGMRAWEKAGYRRAGRIGYVKLGPWRRHFPRHQPRATLGR